MGHSAVLLGNLLVIFGGRMSPAQPLADVWALDLPSHTWQCIACKGDPPAARYRHTAVAFGSQTMVLVFPASLPVSCLAVCLSVRPSARLSVCLSVRPSVRLYNMGIRQLPMPKLKTSVKLGWTHLIWP